MSDNIAPDALVRPASSYVRFVTWTFDPASSKWDLAGSAPHGVDTLVTTPHGVIGIDVDWPSKLNDAGYQRTWSEASPRRPAAVYLYSAANRSWRRLDDPSADSPQNLYEMTSLAYDSGRDRLILHGGGAKRDELWTFDNAVASLAQHASENVGGGAARVSREAVYLPKEDVFLTYENGVWTWNASENAWHAVQVPFDSKPESTVGQNARSCMTQARRPSSCAGLRWRRWCRAGLRTAVRGTRIEVGDRNRDILPRTMGLGRIVTAAVLTLGCLRGQIDDSKRLNQHRVTNRSSPAPEPGAEQEQIPSLIEGLKSGDEWCTSAGRNS